MSRRRHEFEPAWVLAARPYRETSLLLEAFSAGHGRIGLVARGARAPKARQRALLQCFVPLLLTWQDSGELGTLLAAEPAAAALQLPGEAIFSGWYLNELLLKLLPRHDAHPGLYEAYGATLPRLAQPDIEPVLRRFELQLLAELGYGLDLDGEFAAEDWYRHDADRGFCIAASGERGAVRGATLQYLRDDRLAEASPAHRREARALLRQILLHQLGGRELETPRLLRELRAGRTLTP